MNNGNGVVAFFLTFLLGGAAWSIAIATHELIGHGGHCAFDANCTWKYADAMYFDGVYESGVKSKWQIASGALAQTALALFAMLILWLTPPKTFSVYVLLWSLMGAGLVQSGAYIAFGQFIHSGMDWAQLVSMAGGDALSKSFALLGGALLVLSGVLACRRLMPRIETKNGIVTGLPFVLAAYLGFAATALGASYFVPTDDRIFMLYGGLGSGALFMFWFLFSAIPRGGPSPILVIRNTGVVTAASTIIIFAYVYVLGNGIQFS